MKRLCECPNHECTNHYGGQCWENAKNVLCTDADEQIAIVLCTACTDSALACAINTEDKKDPNDTH